MNRFLRNGSGLLGMTGGVIDLDGAFATPSGPTVHSVGPATSIERWRTKDDGQTGCRANVIAIAEQERSV